MPGEPEALPVPNGPREQALESSASSIINVDINEGILIQDMDTDTDITEEDSVDATLPAATTNEESKKFLREQLRRTLSGKQGKQLYCNVPGISTQAKQDKDHQPLGPRSYILIFRNSHVRAVGGVVSRFLNF